MNTCWRSGSGCTPRPARMRAMAPAMRMYRPSSRSTDPVHSLCIPSVTRMSLFGDRHRDRPRASLGVYQPLRQTEGLLRSLAAVLGVDIRVPDHTTLSRRGGGLTILPKQV